MNVDAVRSTESGGSCNEMVRIVHVKSTYRLSEGNSKFDAEPGKDWKSDIKENGARPTFLKSAGSIQLNGVVLITQKAQAQV